MHIYKEPNLSYWEIKHYFQTFDLIIVGSGIVGLSTAISFKERNKKARILILEKGVLPNGASTKNAGFACFGSAGELLDDLKKSSAKKVWETVRMRWAGLNLLRMRLKDKNLKYQGLGGFELFTNQKSYQTCKTNIEFLNKEIKQTLGLKNCYRDYKTDNLSFNSVKGCILNTYEGQLDTSLMMGNLLQMARKLGIEILNNICVTQIKETNHMVQLMSNLGIFRAQKVVVATNGFAKSLLKIKDIKPARAQVLITKPIKDLKIKGAFHFNKGYFYFRNINDRILFGGGRNIDFAGETTTEIGLNKKIHQQLDQLLKTIILPKTQFEIEHRWSGIMGVGTEKMPIVQKVGDNVLAAVRMGGMGIAIGTLIGENAAKEIS